MLKSSLASWELARGFLLAGFHSVSGRDIPVESIMITVIAARVELCMPCHTPNFCINERLGSRQRASLFECSYEGYSVTHSVFPPVKWKALEKLQRLVTLNRNMIVTQARWFPRSSPNAALWHRSYARISGYGGCAS